MNVYQNPWLNPTFPGVIGQQSSFDQAIEALIEKRVAAATEKLHARIMELEAKRADAAQDAMVGAVCRRSIRVGDVFDISGFTTAKTIKTARVLSIEGNNIVVGYCDKKGLVQETHKIHLCSLVEYRWPLLKAGA